MEWVGLLSVLLFSFAFMLGIIYVSTAITMGYEVAQRTTELTLVLFLLLIPFGFLIYLPGKYGLVGFQIFITIAVLNEL